MEKLSPLNESAAILKLHGLPYRLRMEGTPANPRSPWCSLRRTTDGRQVVVRGLRWADTEGVLNATDHLRRQNKERDLKTLALELRVDGQRPRPRAALMQRSIIAISEAGRRRSA